MISTQKKIYLTSIGHDHPATPIPNAQFDSLGIGSSAEWIEERTGIKSRHSILPWKTIEDLRAGNISITQLYHKGLVTSIAEMSEKPWLLAQSRHIQGSAFKPDLLVCGTSVPDYDIPANAAPIAERLNFDCTVFDVNSACSSFVVDLSVVAALLKTRAYERATIFNVERYTTRLNYNDRKSCILFGDGACATIVESLPEQQATSGFEVIDTLICSEPSGYKHVTIEVGKHFDQNGSAVQKFAISKTCSITLEILKKNGLKVQDVHYFIGHQANLRMLQVAVKKLGFEETQHLYNVNYFGNQGGAGAPIVLSQNWEKIPKGSLVVISVVGSGLTWGSTLLKKI